MLIFDTQYISSGKKNMLNAEKVDACGYHPNDKQRYPLVPTFFSVWGLSEVIYEPCY